MIEINLLPGSGKKTSRSRASAGANLGAQFQEALAKVKDPYLVGSVAAALLAVAAVAGMFLFQQRTENNLTEREQQAAQDSTRYAAVLKDRRKAEAKRDSVVSQLGIIRSIDNTRFVWPHVMSEIARVLPAYTWLTLIQQTSATPTAATIDAASKGDKNKKPDPAAVPVDTMRFQIVGNTVDIQALTYFIRQLEASPFIQNVQLGRTDAVTVEGKDATQFQLNAEYQWPDPSAIRTVPVTVTAR
jgi:Tfp pilus assembly protein PilN